MPPTGYSLPTTTDAPVVPAFTGPASQPTSILSVPASSTTSAPATGSGPTSSQQFVSPDHASFASDYDALQATSDKESEEGEISDTEGQEKNEEMNYRETVRAVRTFLGFTHIPDFEASTGDYDRSDNPWKGKHPRKSGKVSVELPADDLLCHKIEKLNTRAAEGYPSKSQESAGLKQDQFIRTPKSQVKWYRQSRLRPEDPQRPGRNVFNWSDSEARLNAQFSRVAKSPPILSLARLLGPFLKTSAREGSYITNHAAAFSRCTSEIQEKMGEHINFLQEVVVKGNAPKEVTDAIKEVKDLSAFHTSVSFALGTSLQQLTDNLFVQLANFVILGRDSYLDYLKAGVKPDTWNRLRNAPLFSSGLFSDDVLAIAEQDIIKHENNQGAQVSLNNLETVFSTKQR